MTDIEIDALTRAMTAFLDTRYGRDFLLTNEAMATLVRHFGRRLRENDEREDLLTAMADTAGDEQDLLLKHAYEDRSMAAYAGSEWPVVSNDQLGNLLRAPCPRNHEQW